MAAAMVELKITGVPEALALMRGELGRLLRKMAKQEENAAVGARLVEIAGLFEAGLSEPPEGDGGVHDHRA